MRLVTYLHTAGPARAGALLEDARVLDLAGAGQACGVSLPSNLLGLLDLGPSGLEEAAAVVEQARRLGLPALPLAEARLLAPLPRPRKVLAVAGNYVDHLVESRMAVPEKTQTTIRPFIKPSNSVIGPDDVIRFPRWSTTLDYEAELAIVIGRRATAVGAADASAYIAGYSVFNDISARSLTIAAGRMPRERDRFFDWLAGKWFDTFAPFGPAIVTADEVPDPHGLSLMLTVNGEPRQQASTAQMIFTCGEIVSFFSHLTTLEPGDVIATGTPAGVGTATRTYLKPGDVIEATIERLGTLRNTVGAT
jgi:2-keto-4-pentenoate hydratase/2-oxohepta-3-ene-1,7-dioic acid hydratase in catechol pathway